MLAAAISCVGGSGFGGVAGCGEFGVVVISLVGASDRAGDTLPIVEVYDCQAVAAPLVGVDGAAAPAAGVAVDAETVVT